MMTADEQQVIALAATVQALSIVQEVAVNGQLDSNRALPIFHSLIHYNPDDTLAAYDGDCDSLHFGLGQLKRLFSDQLDRDIAQYLLAVVTIERKLVINTQMRHLLQTELQQINYDIRQMPQNDPFADDDFDSVFEDEISDGANENPIDIDGQLLSSEIIARFAAIYKQTASHIEPRIMIKGNHQYLQSETFANQIRALLLGALRGAAFFRHYGGRRMDFMLKRKQYIAIINHLL